MSPKEPSYLRWPPDSISSLHLLHPALRPSLCLYCTSAAVMQPRQREKLMPSASPASSALPGPFLSCHNICNSFPTSSIAPPHIPQLLPTTAASFKLSHSMADMRHVARAHRAARRGGAQLSRLAFILWFCGHHAAASKTRGAYISCALAACATAHHRDDSRGGCTRHRVSPRARTRLARRQ